MQDGTPGVGPDEHGAERRPARLTPSAWRELLLFLGLLCCYGFFQQVPAWNENSRYDLTRALVRDRTTIIDPYHENTGDKSIRDGHYYSDKAPGTSLIAVPPYAALVAISTLTGEPLPGNRQVVAILAWFASGLLTAMLAVLLVRFLRPVVGDPWALVVAAGFALGSIAFPFATMFFGHAASAFFLFAGFYALWRSRTGGPAWLPALAGFLGGWAVLSDISCALGVAILAGYALLAGASSARLADARRVRLDLRTAALFAVGGLLPAAILFAYNAVSFGSPFSVGYTNLRAGGFAEGMSQGILGVTMPKAAVLVDLLVGPRGLLRLAPWFVLVPAGALALRRREVRPEVIVSIAMVVGFLLFNAGYYLPFGGWTPGPRFLTPALPFAAILVALVPSFLRPLVAALIAASIVLVFVATVTMPNAPEAYADPLVQLWLPRFLTGDLADTWAWLAWGVPVAGTLALLLAGIVLTELGVVATFSEGRLARLARTAAAAALIVLLVGFSMPFLSWRTTAAVVTDDGGITITDVGDTPTSIGDAVTVSLWSRIRNDGAALLDTRVEFSVHTGPGASWKAWAGDVDWAAGDRKTVGVTWDAAGEPPGDYPYEVMVVSEAEPATVYARASGVISLAP